MLIYQIIGQKVISARPYNYISILLSSILAIILLTQRSNVVVETEINYLWSEKVIRELDYRDDVSEIRKFYNIFFPLTGEDPQARKRKLNAPTSTEEPAATPRTSGGTWNIIQGPYDKSNSVLNQEYLIEHLEFMKDLQTVKLARVDGTDYYLSNLCSKIDAPEELATIAETLSLGDIIPCTRMTVLDCFTEGDFDFPITQAEINLVYSLPTSFVSQELKDQMQFDYGIFGYGTFLGDAEPRLPSLYTSSDEEILETINAGCTGWVTELEAMHWPNPAILGSIKYATDTTSKITSANSFFTGMQMASSTQLSARLGLSSLQAKEVIEQSESNMRAYLASQASYSDKTQVLHLHSSSLNEVLEDVSSLDYIAILASVGMMAIFTIATLSFSSASSSSKLSKLNYLPLLGLLGLTTVCVVQQCGYGAMYILGVESNVTTNSVLPFLALGLGVDDMFLLLRAFQGLMVRGGMRRSENYDDDIDKGSDGGVGDEGETESMNCNCTAKAVSEVGSSMAMTSSSNFVAFFAASLVPVPLVSNFCRGACIVITLNFLYILFFFAPIISLVEGKVTRNQREGRVSVRASNVVNVNVKHGLEVQGGNLVNGNGDDGEKVIDLAIPNSNDGQGMIKPDAEAEAGVIVTTTESASSAVTIYGRAILAVRVKMQTSKSLIFAMVLQLVILVVSCIGVQNLEYGLEITDIVERDTTIFKFGTVYQQDYHFSEAEVWQGNVFADVANLQKELLDVIKEIGEIDTVYRVDDWYLPRMLHFINTTSNSPFQLIEVEPYWLLKPIDYIDAVEWWLENDFLAKEIMPTPWIEPSWVSNPLNAADRKLGSTRGQYSFSLKLTLFDLRTVQDTLNFIRESRRIMAKTGTKRNLNDSSKTKTRSMSLFGYGEQYTFNEQYLSLEAYFGWVASAALVGIFLVTVATCNIPCAACMTLSIVCMIVELIGFLGWFNIKVSALPMVTIISCLGISVEYVGHITKSFCIGVPSLEAEHGGSGKERLQYTLSHVALPIVDGSISTFLGVAWLGTSKFGFVRKYFFLPYVLIGILGLITSLIILPSLLCIVYDAFRIDNREGKFGKVVNRGTWVVSFGVLVGLVVHIRSIEGE